MSTKSWELHLSLGKVAGVVLGILFFWAVVRQVKPDGRLKIAVVAFVLSSGVPTTVALLGIQMPSAKLPALKVFTDRLPMLIHGVPGAEYGFNPNAVSGCLILFVPLLLTLLVGSSRAWLLPMSRASRAARWSTWALIGLLQAVLLLYITATIVLLQSRSAWLGLLVALVGFMLWYTRATRLLLSAATLG